MTELKDLTDRELRRLSRRDLLMLLLEQQKRVEALEQALREEKEAREKALSQQEEAFAQRLSEQSRQAEARIKLLSSQLGEGKSLSGLASALSSRLRAGADAGLEAFSILMDQREGKTALRRSGGKVPRRKGSHRL